MTEIFPIQVTRTMKVSPKEYLEFCAENEDEPTQKGFYEFIEDWIDDGFRCDDYDNQIITILIKEQNK